MTNYDRTVVSFAMTAWAVDSAIHMDIMPIWLRWIVFVVAIPYANAVVWLPRTTSTAKQRAKP